MERALPRHNEVWRHFKDKLYWIVTIAQHTETETLRVVLVVCSVSLLDL